MRVQIVEDDRALSEGIAIALAEPGIEFVQSISVRTAREAFENRKPELLILDINLPDGSFEVSWRIRRKGIHLFRPYMGRGICGGRI